MTFILIGQYSISLALSFSNSVGYNVRAKNQQKCKKTFGKIKEERVKIGC